MDQNAQNSQQVLKEWLQALYPRHIPALSLQSDPRVHPLSRHSQMFRPAQHASITYQQVCVEWSVSEDPPRFVIETGCFGGKSVEFRSTLRFYTKSPSIVRVVKLALHHLHRCTECGNWQQFSVLTASLPTMHYCEWLELTIRCYTLGLVVFDEMATTARWQIKARRWPMKRKRWPGVHCEEANSQAQRSKSLFLIGRKALHSSHQWWSQVYLIDETIVQ